MSVLLALAIIIAIIAVTCAVKAVRAVAKNVPCAATTATETHAGATTPVVDVVNPNHDCMEAVVMILAYAKASLKEERLNGRRARARAWHINNCASKEAARKARKEAMAHISAAQRNAENKTKANQWMVGKSWQEAISALYNEGKLISVRKHREVKTATMRVHKPRVARTGVPATKPVAKPVRTYVRQAANKPGVISGAQLAQQARATGTSLVTQIRVAKATLTSLYDILPLARQVVGLSNKANRKVGMYTWLADEGHVGVRSTKSSIARRDAAQEVVCQAALAAEAFKDAYGIEASEVVSQILVVKAAKARAVEMLRDHKAEQHRLFIERQERRAAKAALKASKAAPVAAPAVTEVVDWEQYASANNGNKAIAFALLGAKGSTMAEKISASLAIAGVHHESDLVTCETVDAAYVVAA